MKHPFDLSAAELETLDLEFEEDLPLNDPNLVSGGLRFTTQEIGEEGGSSGWLPHLPKGFPPIHIPRPPIATPHPPQVTTLALGEEGGVTTLALGEEGGCA